MCFIMLLVGGPGPGPHLLSLYGKEQHKHSAKYLIRHSRLERKSYVWTEMKASKCDSIFILG